jgi:tRNA pseudouridine55 synthase
MNGIFLIDKPEGMTSHDVVQAIRKKFKVSKVGHFGTLDPMATGVLPIAAGQATRMAQFIPNLPKEYEGEIRLGFATNTYDREGVPAAEERPVEGNIGNIEAAMLALTGIFDQMPPPFSAKKIGGVPAYKFARKNRAIPLTASRVKVQEFQMLGLDLPRMKFRVVCSPGTYIRSLAHDLGQRLGCGAHLTALRRTRSGGFQIEDATPLEKLTAGHMIPLNRLLESMPRIEISESDESKVAHGNPIRGEAESETVRIFNKKGEFVAVASIEKGWVRPRLVLTSINSRPASMLGCILEKEIES